MLTDVSIPTSTGFSSIKDNLGLVRNSGIELNANYTIWQGPEGFVNLYGTFVYNKNKIIRLSDSMRAYNEKMQKMAEEANQSAPVLMYQDGMSMNTIWAVPSAGIDPQTGQEVYIKKMEAILMFTLQMIWFQPVIPVLNTAAQEDLQLNIKESELAQHSAT